MGKSPSILTLLLILLAGLAVTTAQGQPERDPEIIAIIGTGNVGSTLGKIWAAAGHRVIYGSRSPDSPRVQRLLADTGFGATATSQADAARQGDIVMIPIPPTAIDEVMVALGNMAGKIVLDPTNWWTIEDGFAGAPRDPRRSLARQVQDLAPGASVVKAFNTLNFAVMADPEISAGPVTVPIAGDDVVAKQRVARLVEDVGLEPLDVGPLQAAQYLEEMLRLAIGFRELNPGLAFDYHLRLREN